MTKTIVLLSGGLDSFVSLAKTFQDTTEILALTFNYGQKSFVAELSASEKISKFYNIEHKVVELPWLAQISTSSLNTKEEVPVLNINNLDDDSVTSDTANSVWVPNRNGLFVNIAACYAEANGYDTIVIGANKEEAATFKDNTIEFINAVNESFSQSMNKKVALSAPLINLTKDEIVKLGIELNIPFELVHSCYVDNNLHCGKCESCLRLKRALLKNQREDIIKKIFKD